MKLIDMLRVSASNRADMAAVIFGQVNISYGQMLCDAERLAGELRRLGCRPGVKVGLLLGNSAEYLMSFFAVSASGGAIVPLSVEMTAYELNGLVERADVSIVVAKEALAKRLLLHRQQRQAFSVVYISYGDGGVLQMAVAVEGKCTGYDGDADIALMVSTSGTTGRGKLVMLTDEQLISNMAVYRLLMGFEGANAAYCSLAFHHIYCICAQILTHISLGDTLVVHDGPFFIRDFLHAVESYRITITAFVPYMAILLSEYEEAESVDISSLKYVTLSGARTPKATYERLTARYPCVRFINTYGMSEAGSRISIAMPFCERFPVESVGRPMPGVCVRIADENGGNTAAGCCGEILVKSSGVMKGYYREPELTAATIAEGWLKTGDLGKLDEEGNLFILGRKKDVIVTGGDKVCPAEIEECLAEHPAIREAAVVGQRHKLLDEVPYAFAVRREGFDEPTAAELVRFCRMRLSSHKIPRSVRFIEGLPKLGSSKIDRNRLREMADSDV